MMANTALSRDMDNSSLVGLPLELLFQITSYLEERDIRSLRLASRVLEDVTFESFACKHFSQVQIHRSKSDLQRLIDMADSHLRPYIKQVWLGAAVADLSLAEPSEDRRMLARAFSKLDLDTIGLVNHISPPRSCSPAPLSWDFSGSFRALVGAAVDAKISPRVFDTAFDFYTDDMLDCLPRQGGVSDPFCVNLRELHIQLYLTRKNRRTPNWTDQICDFLGRIPHLHVLHLEVKEDYCKTEAEKVWQISRWLGRALPSHDRSDCVVASPATLNQITNLKLSMTGVCMGDLLAITDRFSGTLKSLELDGVWFRNADSHSWMTFLDGLLSQLMRNRLKLNEIDIKTGRPGSREGRFYFYRQSHSYHQCRFFYKGRDTAMAVAYLVSYMRYKSESRDLSDETDMPKPEPAFRGRWILYDSWQHEEEEVICDSSSSD
ncbi:hypothetical protein F5Y18DRAFT_393577 [Xylariaceae sp. FL1019]|nr:hypothetical protein F5Y18DRAFT_393577 [Xylariaceae sp. FL1019]